MRIFTGSAIFQIVSALEIIEQIRQLPDDEQEKIKQFVRGNLEDGQISPEAIGELTRQMVESNDPAEKARLRKELVKGFYGNAPHA